MDYLIKNARVVDGTGVPAYTADVAITGDIISKIGTIDEYCPHTIDAAGYVLMPGIIDPHSHADAGIFNPDWSHQRIVQGITTEITGHCGPSLLQTARKIWNCYGAYTSISPTQVSPSIGPSMISTAG